MPSGPIDTITPNYSLFQIGYSKLLVKDDPFYIDLPITQSSVNSPVNPANVASGPLVQNLIIEGDQLVSTNFVTGVSGWRLGPTSAEFIDVTVSGTLTAGNIHIPDQNTTTSSFHVNDFGDTWWGATETNFNSNPENATAYVLKTGVVKFASGVIAGWTLASTSLSATTGGNTVTLSTGATAFVAGPTGSPSVSITRAGAITATSGAIGGWNLATSTLASSATESSAGVSMNSSTSLIRLGSTAGNYLNLDGANLRIRSSNYVSGALGAGFTLEPDLLEVGNIRARGRIITSVFQKDSISAVGGKLVVTNSDVLASDMTALDASTITITGNSSFLVNDILVIADGTNTEYMQVTSAASAPTYTVTRDLAGAFAVNTNPIWKKGTAAVVFGNASAGGWLYMVGSGTNSPYYAIVRRTGSAYNAYSEYARFGNLNGMLDYVTDIYGFAVGTSTNFISIDPTNGLRLVSSLPNAVTINAGGSILMKEGGGINFSEVTDPGAPTAALVVTGVGNVDNGTHVYKVTFVTTAPVFATSGDGESGLGTASNTVTVDGTHKQVSLSGIPVSSSSDVTKRKIYRSKAGDTTRFYLLATINDNTTTTYANDNTADSGLGVEMTNRLNTTTGAIGWDGLPILRVFSFNIGVAHDALEDITTGDNNIVIGYEAGDFLTSGSQNTLVGTLAGINLTTGSNNTLIGGRAGLDTSPLLATGSGNVFLGYKAGDQETTSNKLYIANTNTTTPLLYGEFDTPLLKVTGELQINGRYDGWTTLTSPDNSMVYSAVDGPTFTIEALGVDLRGKLNKGMRFRCVQDDSAYLKSFYKFNETGGTTVTDSGSGAHNGTASRSNILNQSGGQFNNKGLFAAASSDKVTITDHADFKPTGSFSVGGWVNPTTGDIWFQSYSGNTNIAGWRLTFNGNQARIISGKNTGTTVNTDYVDITGTTNLGGAWHFVVATWNGTWLRLYVDGVLENEVYWTNAPAYAATNYVRIGCGNSSGSDVSFYDGSIDNVFILNGKALSQSEILEWYRGTETSPASTISTKYFLVSSHPTYTSGNSFFTVYGGTDYVLRNATITTPSVSIAKSPVGLPTEKSKWTEMFTDAVTRSQAAPTTATWYNVGTSKLDVPIGDWSLYYFVNAGTTRASTTSQDMWTTLATINNGETDTDMGAYSSVAPLPSNTSLGINVPHTRQKDLTLKAKTTYYLNMQAKNFNSDSLLYSNTVGRCVIKSVSTLL